MPTAVCCLLSENGQQVTSHLCSSFKSVTSPPLPPTPGPLIPRATYIRRTYPLSLNTNPLNRLLTAVSHQSQDFRRNEPIRDDDIGRLELPQASHGQQIRVAWARAHERTRPYLHPVDRVPTVRIVRGYIAFCRHRAGEGRGPTTRLGETRSTTAQPRLITLLLLLERVLMLLLLVLLLLT